MHFLCYPVSPADFRRVLSSYNRFLESLRQNGFCSLDLSDLILVAPEQIAIAPLPNPVTEGSLEEEFRWAVVLMVELEFPKPELCSC
jgi:hypothetical protein